MNPHQHAHPPLPRLGIFTSATLRTITEHMVLLEREAGVPPGGLFDHRLVLFR